jgi:hypothetical protein
MNNLRVRLAITAVAAVLAALPAIASAAPNSQVGGSERAVEPMLIWMAIGVTISAVCLGALYLFKRRIGAFPKNPAWTAPISIMRSSDLPGDRDPHGHGAGAADQHGAAGHAAGH